MRARSPDAPTFTIQDTPGGPIVLAIYGPDGRLQAERELDAGAALVMAQRLLSAALRRLQRGLMR